MVVMSALRPLLQIVLPPALAFVGTRSERTISAMVRIRNEEEYLRPAVESIIDLVDEVVLIDNLSDDSTPEVIESLRADYPDKVRARRYPHRIARPGAENVELAAAPGGLKSPRLLANYYNWCLRQCSSSYVLKWDADTIATPSFHAAMEAFPHAGAHVLYVSGINIHEDRRHLVAGHPIEDDEPRLFPRRLARYDNGFHVWERLRSPWDRFGKHEVVEQPSYVHMKYCKQNRFSNISPELLAEETKFSVPGEPLSDEALATIATWSL